MIDYLLAALYGIVEGITEWLPVSSTGHLILLDELLPMQVSSEFWSMFMVVIQLGAILAVVILYWDRIWPVGLKTHHHRKRLIWKKDVLLLLAKALVGCIPAAIVGVLFDDWLDAHLYNWQVVAVMLILVGMGFLVVERRTDRTFTTTTAEELSFRQAFLIGLFQLIAAIFPGTSRSGATILGGMILGVSRKAAADFTFIMAIPVMAGASLLKLVKFGASYSGREIAILAIGMIVAFAVSFGVIKALMHFIQKHSFAVFGIYRIVLGILVMAYFGFLRALF